MERVKLLEIPVLAAVVLGLSVGARPAVAQSKEARGTATAVSDSSLTVKVGAQEMTFAVDSKTRVLGRSGGKTAGKKTRDAQAAGAPGIKLTDVVKNGGAVLVKYSQTGSTLQATEIRTVSTPGAGGGSVRDPGKNASGKVKSVAAAALTVTSDGKDWTFDVDGSTKVVGKGAGTATKEAGGSTSIANLVHVGDTVSVSYHEMSGGKMHAAEVRVTIKAP